MCRLQDFHKNKDFLILDPTVFLFFFACYIGSGEHAETGGGMRWYPMPILNSRNLHVLVSVPEQIKANDAVMKLDIEL